jgi:hypothetical protein
MRRFALILILLLVPIQASLSTSETDWWNLDWHYRVPVTVTSESGSEGLVSLEINLTELMDELGVNREPDFGSLRVIHKAQEVPFVLSFTNQVKIEDLEGSLDSWKLSKHIVSEKSEDAVEGAYSLKFRKGSLEDVSNILELDQQVLRKGGLISFFGKGNFTVALRDRSFPIWIASVEVSSDEYRRYFISYDPDLLYEGREYALFFIPRDHFTYNYVDDIMFVSGNAVLKWRASVPAGQKAVFHIYFDEMGEEPRSVPLYKVQGTEKGFSVELGDPEGFRTIIKLNEDSVLSGKVEIRAEVLGNLSNIVKVQYRVDYSSNFSWDSPLGLWGEMYFDEGEWVGELDTTRTYDGLHVITVRAFEESGRFSTASVRIYVRNVQYEEPVNLNPEAEEFTFLVLGDNRPGSSKDPMPQVFWQLAKAMSEEGADMVFNTGDVVYAGEFKEYVRFREVVSMLSCPLFIARGNHEVSIGKAGEENFRHFFDAPGFSYNSYYSFDYGNSHFIILNANVQEHKYSVNEPQLSWFINDIRANREAEHIFIFIHQPIFEYAHGLENRTSERVLEEVIEENAFYPGRIYVFQGHEHMYYQGTSNNVTWYITGGGGAELDAQYPDETLFFHYLKVTVRGREVKVEAVKPLVLEINEPKGDVVHTSDPYLKIRGRTQTGCRLTVNGKEVIVSPTGVFETRIKLAIGRNDVLISVEDPATGDSISREITAIYKPQLEVDMPDRLKLGSEIEVRVESLGTPVEGAVIMIGDIQGTTNSQGLAKVQTPVVDGEKKFIVVVTKQGYTDFVKVVVVTAGVSLPLTQIAAFLAIAVILLALAFIIKRRRT